MKKTDNLTDSDRTSISMPSPGDTATFSRGVGEATSDQYFTTIGSSFNKSFVEPKELSAKRVADYIVWLRAKEGDVTTNLHVQRLLYYAQAWHLAIYDEPLFPETFEAWAVGPVIPKVYFSFSDYQSRPIDPPPIDWKPPEEFKEHVDEVMETYGGFSSFDLGRIICNEEPWLSAREGLEIDEESSSAEISNEKMREFYKSQLDEQE